MQIHVRPRICELKNFRSGWEPPLGSIGTIVALLVAVYSILPRRSRIQISLRYGVIFAILSLLVLIPLLALNVFDLWTHPELLAIKPLEYAIDHITSITLLAFVFMIVISVIRWKMFRLPRRKLTKLYSLLKQLWQDKHLGELSDIFLRFYGKIERIANSRKSYWLWRAKLLDPRQNRYIRRKQEMAFELYFKDLLVGVSKLVPQKIASETPVVKTSSKLPLKLRAINAFMRGMSIVFPSLKKADAAHFSAFFRRIGERVCRGGATILPSGEDHSTIAKAIMKYVLLMPDMIEYWARNRPEDALIFISKGTDLSYTFSDLFLAQQMETANSRIYVEVQNNLNCGTDSGYYIDSNNVILNHFFSDISLADTFHVWTPIGGSMINELERLFALPVDPYNTTCGQFALDGKWHSLLFVGIRLFDIMVRAALESHFDSHMFLFYYVDTAKHVIRNSQFDNIGIDEYDEWPTKYCYLFYEIFSNLRDWILVGKSSKGWQTDDSMTESVTKPDIICDSAIKALSQCLYAFIISSKFPVTFERYIFNIVVYIYEELRKTPSFHSIATTFINEISRKQYRSWGSSDNYLQKMQSLLEEVDTMHLKTNDESGWSMLRESLQ
jgi:hypothetical protein